MIEDFLAFPFLFGVVRKICGYVVTSNPEGNVPMPFFLPVLMQFC